MGSAAGETVSEVEVGSWFDEALALGIEAAKYRAGGAIQLKPELVSAVKSAKKLAASFAQPLEEAHRRAVELQSHLDVRALQAEATLIEAQRRQADKARRAHEKRAARRKSVDPGTGRSKKGAGGGAGSGAGVSV